MATPVLLKTLSYAAMHMTISIAVSYILSGSWKVALAIGLVEPCAQTVAFFFHEKAWHRVEERQKAAGHHDSVIDSVSPVAQFLEKVLRHRH